jgi:Family of unknown function (DUF6364)
MATLTIAIDPELLEAAKLEAERRKTSLDQMIADYLTGVAQTRPTDADNEALIRLMYEGRLGNIDRPLTREEIYAERTWPRS